MMKTKCSLTVGALLCLIFNFSVQAGSIKQITSVKMGYELLLDAESKNPNLYDQPYLSFQHVTFADWGSAAGWLRLENPTGSAKNQQGQEANATVKAWLKLDYNLGHTPFNLWVQSYTFSNSLATEEDFYLGASYDIAWGKLRGTLGVGGHYSWGAFSPSGQSYNGMNGGAANLLLGYPLTSKLMTKLYYEVQFGRSEEKRAVMNFEDTGHLLIVDASYFLTKQLWAGVSYRYRNSWGGAKDEGGNLFVELGYRF